MAWHYGFGKLPVFIKTMTGFFPHLEIDRMRAWNGLIA
jgi:hypothetical protein